MINNLIDESQQFTQLIHKHHHHTDKPIRKKKLKLLHQDGIISLKFIYPIRLKYRYINQVLHHLVATINKSPSILFLAKVDFDDASPLFLTFYYTALASSKTTSKIDKKDVRLSSCNLMVLTDLIYEQILLICQGYSINHSPFAQANKLLQYMETCTQQQKQFLSQIEDLSQQAKNHSRKIANDLYQTIADNINESKGQQYKVNKIFE